MRAWLAFCILWGLALAQAPGRPENPAELPLEKGIHFSLLAPSLAFENNTLTQADLLNVLALLQDPRPTDLLLLAGRVPKGQASTTQVGTELDVIRLAVPFGFGEDPLSGTGQYAIGLRYALGIQSGLQVGKDLVALAQEGSRPGDVLRFADTFGTVALWDRLALSGAVPVLDGLLEAGVEVSLLLGRLVASGAFNEQSQLTYGENGYSGQLGMSFYRGGGGMGFETALGLRTRLPTFGVAFTLRTLGRIHYPNLTLTRLYAEAQDDTAYDLLNKFKDSAQTSSADYTLYLPTQVELSGFYPLFLEGMDEPLFLTGRITGSFGGPLATGWRLALGSAFQPTPHLNLRSELALGGPALFSLGFGTTLDLAGAKLEFWMANKGGILLGAKGAEVLLRSRFVLGGE
ncbi:hypothetical protein FJNA_21080 [Thermus sp. FJN-A]